jgi:hypothetical protein
MEVGSMREEGRKERKEGKEGRKEGRRKEGERGEKEGRTEGERGKEEEPALLVRTLILLMEEGSMREVESVASVAITTPFCGKVKGGREGKEVEER